MKIIAIVSGKGGVGKTTTTANLSIALVQFGKKVLVVDGNLLAPNLGLHFGIYHYSKTFLDLLRREATFEQVMQVHESGVHVIPCTASAYSLRAAAPALESTLRSLKGYDFCLVDTAPGLEREVFPILEVSDEVIVVTNPEYPSVTDAKRTLEIAKASGIQIRGVELNRARRERHELSALDVQYVCEIPVISIIPERSEVRRSIAAGVPVVLSYPNSPASIEFKRLAAFLVGEKYEAGFMQKLRSLTWFMKRRKIEAMLKEKAPPMPPPKEVVEVKIPPPPEKIVEEIVVEAKKPAPEIVTEKPKPEAPKKPVPKVEVEKPELSDEERKKLEKSKAEIETLLSNLQKQFEKGIIPERIYKKLKDKNEETLKGIVEKLKWL